MPYVQTTWVDNTTPASQTNMNHLETQYTEATNSLQPGTYAGFVQSGLIAAKDATTASQLDVTAGVAWLLQTDNTLRQRALTASTQSTAGLLSATVYLDLNPDGTWSFATTHSAVANYLTIATVTTDGSGNITGITDTRATAAQEFPTMQGSVTPAPHNEFLSTAVGWGANTGQIVGSVTTGVTGLIAGSQNKAMQFPGASSYVTLPPTGLPTGGSAVSIECWLSIASYPAATTVPLFYGAAQTTGGYDFVINTSGTAAANLVGNQTVGTTTNPLSLNQPHHLVLTYDGTNGRFYVDGVLVGTSAAVGMAAVASSFLVGCYPGPTQYFTGVIDEVAIYSAALSGTQVSNHYSVGYTGSNTTTYAKTVLADSPARYYRLDDSTGSGRDAAIECVAEHSAVIASDGGISPTYVAGIGGQAATGNFGVPVIVAQAIRVNVTTSGSTQTILSYTPGATGLYRVSAHLTSLSTTITNNLLALEYTDPDSSTGIVAMFSDTNPSITEASGTAAPMLNGVYGVTTTSSHPTSPILAYAEAGQPIMVKYRVNATTANDYISVIIERMA